MQIENKLQETHRKGRLGFHVDRENTTGIGGDLLTESLHEYILKKTFVFHLSALALPVL